MAKGWSARVWAVVTTMALIISVFPVTPLAMAASAPHIDLITTPSSTYASGQAVVLKVVRGETFPATGTVQVQLTSANGGLFSTGTLGGACTGSFVAGPFYTSINGDDSQKAFCYKNTNAGDDTITAVFTQGSSFTAGTDIETDTEDLEIAAAIEVPCQGVVNCLPPEDPLPTPIHNPDLPASCSFAGTVIENTPNNLALTNSGAQVALNRRDVTHVENGPASYQNPNGQEPTWAVNDFFSLGIGGYLVYEFTGSVVIDNPGDDIAIYEITDGATSTKSDEKVEVLVSTDNVTYVSLGIFTADSEVDVAPAALPYVKYVKLVDKSQGVQGPTGDGYDVDAIVILDEHCGKVPPPPPTQCSITIYSDETNTVVEKAGAAAKIVPEPYNVRWLAVVPSPALWIWGDNPVVDPVNDTTQTFEKTFGWNGPVTSATLTIAADNSYVVDLNGNQVAADLTEFNYFTAVDYDLTSDIATGNNLLSFTIKNFAQAGGTNATNPAGLKYKLVITGTDPDCDTPYEEVPTVSTVTMCKYDNKENPLADWKLMLLGNKIDEVTVPAADSAGVDTAATLTASTSYVAVASGSWDNNRGPLNIVDAEYSTEDNWATHMDGFGLDPEILELSTNNAVDPLSDWGYYNSLHTYAQMFTQASGTANFSIKDSYYGDNSGSLNVAVYKGFAGMTGQNGCVTFTDVPVGEYVVSEMMKDGWKNVGGLDAVTVDEATELFNVYNKRNDDGGGSTDKVATVVATKIVCTDETDLPNWGATGGDNITATTAETWVAAHASCSLVPNWEFQWAPQTASNPDNNLPTAPFYGPAGDDWTTFGPTDAQGSAALTLTAAQLGGQSHIWMREVLKAGYLPFTYASNHKDNSNNASAEFYCGTDVLNYDNYDRVDGIAVDNTYYCVAWNHKVEAPQPLVCESKVDLLANGSFEHEVVTDPLRWEIFTSVLGWDVSSVSNGLAIGLEHQRNWSNNVAAAGSQYAELDGNESTLIKQTVPTIVGETYTLSWAFAPRQLTAADQNELIVLVNGGVVATNGPKAAMGTLAQSSWATSSYAFIATASSTEVSFKNGGPSDSFGTFLDDVQLHCATPVVVIPTDDTYKVEGYVWNDVNENGIYETASTSAESPLANWVVAITNGSTTATTTSDVNGLYTFTVPAGNWTITESLQSGWSTTTPSTYAVSVPVAHEYNFGNVQDKEVVDEGGNGDGGGTSLSEGRRHSGSATRTNRDQDQDEDLGMGGDFPFAGQVLGDQVSVVPNGAPNTGHGGAAPAQNNYLLIVMSLLFIVGSVTIARIVQS